MIVPNYIDIVNYYKLDILKQGGDLQLTSTGDIEVHDGDLKLGDNSYNAIFRLVNRWLFNTPTLAVLFESIAHTREQKNNLSHERNNTSSLVRNPQDFYKLTNEIEAYEFGCGAYSGTIMVVLNNLLQRFKKDIGITNPDDWKNTEPLINGCSVFSIIEAASANFRHYDEWARDANSPTKQQLSSIRIIANCLNVTLEPDGIRHPFRHNVCPNIIEALSSGVYENLNHNIFSFAHSIAKKKRSNQS